MSRGRGRPAGMVEFTPDDEQCNDIVCRLGEGAPDAFKQQLQKDGVQLFAAVCKPPKTKMASRAQLEEHLWLLRPLVDASPLLPYSTDGLGRVWDAFVQKHTANLQKDVIFLHVVEIKMMLQLLGCNRCFWVPLRLLVFPVGHLRRVRRYPKILEIMDVMKEPEEDDDTDVAAMWGLEASETDELTARISAEWNLGETTLQMQISKKRKLLMDHLQERIQELSESEARSSQVTARIAYVAEPDYLEDVPSKAPPVELEKQAALAAKKKAKKSKSASSGKWTPYYVKPVKRKTCDLWVVWDRMQDKQCVQIRKDATPDVESSIRSWVDDLNAGKIELKVLVEATLYACLLRARRPLAQGLLDPLHCIEFFAGQSGSAKIAKCFKQLGRRVQAFDLSSQTHDLDSTEGFLAGLFSILRLRPGSFVHFGTVCTSFTWINAGTHGRRLWLPVGNEHLDYVALGSRLVERTVLLAFLAWHMGAVFSIENPLGSLMAEQPIFQSMIQYFQDKSGGIWRGHDKETGNGPVTYRSGTQSDTVLSYKVCYIHRPMVVSESPMLIADLVRGSQADHAAMGMNRVGDDLETQLEAMIDEMHADEAASCNKRKASEAFEDESTTTADAKVLELRRLKEIEAH
ncbi:unnamed protein product, partial [Symbiodinium sp. CCMP2456]